MRTLPYPGRSRGKDRQNLEAVQRPLSRAIFFELTAAEYLRGGVSRVIGKVPRNCIIEQPTFINIIEAFNGNNIWIKLGTPLYNESVGKVLSHNKGKFLVSNTAFSDLPNDYGVILTEDKIIILSLAAETPSSNPVATKGSLFGILHYTDLTQVEGF